jgi:hypothetical protein
MQSEIVVLLDRSGSMQSARSDHEGGINSFVADQKELGGDVRFTLIQFDCKNPCEVVFDGVPISEVGKCELIPRGGTPLLDAMGLSIAHVKERIKRDGRKPDDVMFMVVTDGHENSSREFTKAQVKSLVAENEKSGWQFLYLGANVDAFAEGGAMGVQMGKSINFANSKAGTQNLYGAVSANRMKAQSLLLSGARGRAVSDAYDFTDSQRAETMATDDPNLQGVASILKQSRSPKGRK